MDGFDHRTRTSERGNDDRRPIFGNQGNIFRQPLIGAVRNQIQCPWRGLLLRQPRYPVVLVCGLTNTAAVWSGARNHLSDDIEVYAPDLPIDDDIDRIAQSFLRVAPSRFHLCGYSFGGYVALAMLAACADRI